MPPLQLDPSAPAAVQAQAVAVFATKGEGAATLGADAQALGAALDLDLAQLLAGVRFEGDAGSVARVPARGGGTMSVVLVVGVGAADGLTLESLRRGAGAAARNAAKDSVLAIVIPGDLPTDAAADERAQAVAEGAGLGAYAFTKFRTKTNDSPSLERILLLPGEGVDPDACASGVERGSLVAESGSLARDLVNEPPGGKRPPALADRIAELATAAGLAVDVFDNDRLVEGGFGGIAGVGQGSSEPPRLVQLTYDPAGATGHVVLVGKGITFDSGGLSLKPATAMATMKSDMSGAAAVVATLLACGRAGITTKVTGLVALAENMPSGTAIRVSDVLTHRGGKTVEVMNTDAEGRLVLADTLAYGAELEPDAMIDLATLTGAQIVALGPKIAALMGTDEALLTQLEAAAAAAGEQLWRLPLPAEYAEQLRSDVADMKNIGKAGQAGTLIGGLYLKEFAGKIPWAHLDIAGPAFTEEGDAFYTPRGATGFGVRTLLRFLADRQAA